MSSKKTTPKKSTSPVKRRWSLGVFQSAADGEPLVTYCRVDGTVVPYMKKQVRSPKARVHAVMKGVTYQEARRALLKQAGVKPPAKKPVAKEEHLKNAA